jgi:hypothetical protein
MKFGLYMHCQKVRCLKARCLSYFKSGGVRIINTAVGRDGLLRLPSVFSHSSVDCTAISLNYLACVTSDGGLVVWELLLEKISGRVRLCVLPQSEPCALQSVHWDPYQTHILAVASKSNIFLISIVGASNRFGENPVTQDNLGLVGGVLTLSPVSTIEIRSTNVLFLTTSLLLLHLHFIM